MREKSIDQHQFITVRTVLFILISTPVNWNISKVIQDNWMQFSTLYQKSCWAHFLFVAKVIASSHRYVIDRFRKVQQSRCRKLNIFAKKSQLTGDISNSKNSDICFIKIRQCSTELRQFLILQLCKLLLTFYCYALLLIDHTHIHPLLTVMCAIEKCNISVEGRRILMKQLSEFLELCSPPINCDLFPKISSFRQGDFWTFRKLSIT
jgi:hypothetical protein